MILRRGDKGADVLHFVQEPLRTLGYSIDCDGIWGDQTDTIFRHWQGTVGLVADGKFGPLSAAEMRKQTGMPGGMIIDTTSPFPVMSAARRAVVFGRFDWVADGGDNIRILGGWESANIQKFYIPQLDGVPYYEPDGGLKCSGMINLHKLAGPIFQRFFARIEDAGLCDRIRCYDGAFVPRRVRGGSALSNHAWGTAMDINAYANPYHKTPAPVGCDGSVIELVGLAHECGLFWGGNFSGRSVDGMHFEVAVLP